MSQYNNFKKIRRTAFLAAALCCMSQNLGIIAAERSPNATLSTPSRRQDERQKQPLNVTKILLYVGVPTLSVLFVGGCAYAWCPRKTQPLKEIIRKPGDQDLGKPTSTNPSSTTTTIQEPLQQLPDKNLVDLTGCYQTMVKNTSPKDAFKDNDSRSPDTIKPILVLGPHSFSGVTTATLYLEGIPLEKKGFDIYRKEQAQQVNKKIHKLKTPDHNPPAWHHQGIKAYTLLDMRGLRVFSEKNEQAKQVMHTLQSKEWLQAYPGQQAKGILCILPQDSLGDKRGRLIREFFRDLSKMLDPLPDYMDSLFFWVPIFDKTDEEGIHNARNRLDTVKQGFEDMIVNRLNPLQGQRDQYLAKLQAYDPTKKKEGHDIFADFCEYFGLNSDQTENMRPIRDDLMGYLVLRGVHDQSGPYGNHLIITNFHLNNQEHREKFVEHLDNSKEFDKNKVTFDHIEVVDPTNQNADTPLYSLSRNVLLGNLNLIEQYIQDPQGALGQAQIDTFHTLAYLYTYASSAMWRPEDTPKIKVLETFMEVYNNAQQEALSLL